MLKVPLSGPLAVGENETLTVQLCPTASWFSVAAQVFVWEKSPLALIEVISSVEVLVLGLVMVTVWGALTVPTFWPANVRLVGETVTSVAEVKPVPVTVIIWGLPAALSVSRCRLR